LPFRKVGSHRRVQAKDVLEYKANIDQLRLATLNELTTFSQEQGMGYEH
jgi:hypothetical protein